MQLKMYSIRDAKGNVYSPPFLKRMHGEAERDFNQLANDPKTNIHIFAEDYDLYYLGDFDDVSGKIEPLQTPKHILKAVQIKKSSALDQINDLRKTTIPAGSPPQPN